MEMNLTMYMSVNKEDSPGPNMIDLQRLITYPIVYKIK